MLSNIILRSAAAFGGTPFRLNKCTALGSAGAGAGAGAAVGGVPGAFVGGAQQAQIQRDWQEKMWGMNNSYNSPNAMISRGLNPFVQGSAAMAGSKSPASGGAAASAASSPSLQAFRPDFSDVGTALASMAHARAAMIDAEQNAALTPYKQQQLLISLS